LNFPVKLASPVRRHSRRRVFARREGEVGFSYFLDLADREGRIIHFQADGWKLATEPPVFFRRAAGQLALMSRTAPSPHRIDPENRHDRHVETRSAALTRRRTAQPRR
jgi:hypothetical protein